MSTIKRVKLEVECEDGKSMHIEMDDMTLKQQDLEQYFTELGVGVLAALEEKISDE